MPEVRVTRSTLLELHFSISRRIYRKVKVIRIHRVIRYLKEDRLKFDAQKYEDFNLLHCLVFVCLFFFLSFLIGRIQG